MTSEAGVEWRGVHTASVGAVTVEMGGYGTPPKQLALSSRSAKSIISLKLRTLWRLYSYDTLLERLPQDLEHMACTLRELIEAEDAMMRQRHGGWEWSR
jgi:hypothetical protein